MKKYFDKLHLDFRTSSFLFWSFIAAMLWVSIALIFYFNNMDWIANSDVGWYWRTVSNLAIFDSAIQPLYPAFVRAFMLVLPWVEPVVVGQIVSFSSYVLAVPMMYKIFTELPSKKPVTMTLLWAMFPFVGITMSVFPRANALLLLFTVLCYYGYIKGNLWLFLVTASLLPLIHKSSLFFLVFLLLIALLTKKIKLWMLLISAVPTLIYILLGLSKHNSILWWFSFYRNVVPITALPIGDGIVGTLVLGFRGEYEKLIKGIILVSYLLLSLYFLAAKVWKKRLFTLSAIFPIIVLALVLPAREIWSMVNYISYSVIPFSLLGFHDENKLGNKKYHWLYVILIVSALLSNIVFTFYSLLFLGVL